MRTSDWSWVISNLCPQCTLVRETKWSEWNDIFSLLKQSKTTTLHITIPVFSFSTIIVIKWHTLQFDWYNSWLCYFNACKCCTGLQHGFNACCIAFSVRPLFCRSLPSCLSHCQGGSSVEGSLLHWTSSRGWGAHWSGENVKHENRRYNSFSSNYDLIAQEMSTAPAGWALMFALLTMALCTNHLRDMPL